MEKAIVLGGNGFIGSRLCQCLKNHGFKVFSMDIHEPELCDSEITYISGDFFDGGFVKDIIKDKDVIYHAVSTIQPGNSNEVYLRGYSSDMVSSIYLFSQLLGTPKKLIFLSSGGTVYGYQAEQPIKEDVRPQPINHYGNVKLCIENAIRVFNRQMHSNMIIARLSNPYGPGQDYHKGVGFIDAAIRHAISGDKLEIWGEGNIIRDYIFIDDICEMLCALAVYEGKEEVFNLSTGVGTSQKQIVQYVEEICGKLQVSHTRGRSVDVEKIILDNTKIKAIYPKELVSLKTGIGMTRDYLAKQCC